MKHCINARILLGSFANIIIDLRFLINATPAAIIRLSKCFAFICFLTIISEVSQAERMVLVTLLLPRTFPSALEKTSYLCNTDAEKKLLVNLTIVPISVQRSFTVNLI